MQEEKSQESMFDYAPETELEPIVIKFGTVFSWRKNHARKYVIVDVRTPHDGSCDAAEIIGNGKLGFPSTTDREDIGVIYEKVWTKEEVLKALDEGNKGGLFKGSWKINVDAWANKPPRVLK